MDITRVIIQPLFTEKSEALKHNEKQVITLIVDPKANKHEIKEAFAILYGVYPEKINTQLRKPARVRTGTLKPGYTKLTKVAYITLPKGKKVAQTSDEHEEAIKEAVPVKKEAVAKAKGQLKEVAPKNERKETKKVEKPETK